jgi:hypothetical protein
MTCGVAGVLELLRDAPRTIISWPVHTAVASVSSTGALVMGRQESLAGL